MLGSAAQEDLFPAASDEKGSFEGNEPEQTSAAESQASAEESEQAQETAPGEQN
jgi:hypothetical protein